MNEKYLTDKERIEELEARYPDVDWYGIWLDNGRDSLESYVEWYKVNCL